MLNKDKSVQLTIDKEKCINCNQCVSMCQGAYLMNVENEIKASPDSPFGCIQCGFCMMACPEDAINITGEGLSQQDIISLNDNIADYDRLHSLFIKRRSTRKFKKQDLSKEVIEKILESASTAPISIPPSEVKVLVINGFDKVQQFAEDIVQVFEKTLKAMNPLMLGIYRPFMGETQYKIIKEFVLTLLKLTIESRKQGIDHLFYNAPAVLVFYGSEITENVDQVIAATHAYIAAESLGLGTCLIGSVAPAFNRNASLKEKYGLKKNEKVAIAFIAGYPDFELKKGIKRRFKEVRYY